MKFSKEQQDELLRLCRTLVSINDQPEPGLSTWHQANIDTVKEIYTQLKAWEIERKIGIYLVPLLFEVPVSDTMNDREAFKHTVEDFVDSRYNAKTYYIRNTELDISKGDGTVERWDM